MKFMQYTGDLIGLPTSKNHLNFKWSEPNCKVLFSVARQGNGASCHFACDKAGTKKIEQAINEFCEFLFDRYLWCEMIIAKMTSKGVVSIIKRCDFEKLISIGNVKVYIRRRPWVSLEI